jgi:hypothetical protein
MLWTSAGLCVAACTGHLPRELVLEPEDATPLVRAPASLPDAAASDEPHDDPAGTVLRIAASSVSACVLLRDRTASCWGNLPTTVDEVREAGVFHDPRPLSDHRRIAELVLGESEICTLDVEGRARCWGGGLPELPRLAELDMGREIKCARARAGEDPWIFCWPRWYPEQGALLPDFGTVVQIDSKFDHACALTDDGRVHCWGTKVTEPTAVAGIDDVVEIAVGGDHSCARRSDGTLWCWGANYYGQLGDGTTTASHEPRRVLAIDDAVQLVTGAHHGCAREGDGALWCWGWNHWEQIGDGTQHDRPTPVRLSIGAVHDVATYGAHTCAIVEGDEIRCWGMNNLEQLGPHETGHRATVRRRER